MRTAQSFAPGVPDARMSTSSLRCSAPASVRPRERPALRTQASNGLADAVAASPSASELRRMALEAQKQAINLNQSRVGALQELQGAQMRIKDLGVAPLVFLPVPLRCQPTSTSLLLQRPRYVS